MPTAANSIHLIEAKIYWTPTDGAEIELDVREMNADPSTEFADRTGSKSGRWRARKAGIADGEGTVTVYFDKTALPYAIGLRVGQTGTFRVPIYDGGPEYSLPSILGDSFSDTIWSTEDVKVLEINFMSDGEWQFDGESLVANA